METCKISIITPVWNGLNYIEECINSVLAQDFSDWELIISDNGSTDGTREFLDTIKDIRIKIFKQEKNLGIFGNLNFLVDKVSSSFVQILCHDDYFTDPKALKKIVDYWEHVDSKVAFARFNYDDQGNTKATIFSDNKFAPIVSPVDSALCFFTSGNIPGNLSNISLRTAYVKNIEFFKQDLPYAGDFEFWARLASKHSFGINPETVIYVRRHAAVASNYLNKQGEVISQKAIIINSLYHKLVASNMYSSFMLQLTGTLVYDSLERWTGFTKALKGNTAYIKELERVVVGSDFVFSTAFARWAVFFFSLGGRIGRKQMALRLRKKHVRLVAESSLR